VVVTVVVFVDFVGGFVVAFECIGVFVVVNVSVVFVVVVAVVCVDVFIL